MKQRFDESEYIHSWGGYDFGKRNIEVFDTTLRDGLQSPHVRTQPTVEKKFRFLDACAKVGINALEIGFPVASLEHKAEVTELAKYCKEKNYPLTLSCLSRTTDADVQAIIDVSQKAGIPVTANLLIGSSKIRRLVEDWDIKEMIEWIRKSIRLGKKYNLPVEFVTEDTTRTDPETLKTLYLAAIEEGVQGIWIADTVGVATPNSAKNVTKFFMEEIIGSKKVTLDWHGHDDKGLGVANALESAQAGAHRIQATALGVGERAGNTNMEPVIMNLMLAGSGNFHLEYVGEYSESVSAMFDIPIRENYPGVGKFVYSTAAGMHAAAILKARQMESSELEGLVYSPFHPKLFARELEIFVGPMSGHANVKWVIDRLGIEATKEQMTEILLIAKKENRFLTDNEILNFLSPSK